MPDAPRYTDRPLPPYRHVLGRTPHPLRHPEGHSYGLTPTRPLPLLAGNWRQHEEFLYGVDLFNHGYWWESHEAFEALWHVTGRRSPAGHCLQALIQCAAAHLQVDLERMRGAHSLLRRARLHASAAGATTLGIDLQALLDDTAAYLAEPRHRPALLRLDL